MIVPPAPTTPRGPWRRAVRAAGLAAPVMLLVAVAGAGLLGPRPARDAARPSPAAVAPSAAAPAGDPRGADPGPGGEARAAVPPVVADLRVLGVGEAQALLARPDGRFVAVAGWLYAVRGPDACPAATGDTRGTRSPLCARTARLDAAGPVAPDPVPAAAHLHLSVPAGVRLPPGFEGPGPDRPVEVVVVGHAAEPAAPCASSSRGCREQLVADRVAWADGAPFDPGVVFDAGLEVPPASMAFRRLAPATTLAVGWSGTVLVAAVLRPATLALVDPVASAALDAGPRPAGLVWYVRGLETAYDPERFPLGHAPPRGSFAVLDEVTGATLARGEDAAPAGATAAASADAFPRLVAGLPVATVAEALRRRAAAAGTDAGAVVAVAGWLRAWTDPGGCAQPVPGLQAIGCRRAALLVGAPWDDRGGVPAPDPAHALEATVPAGVTIPDRAVGLDDDETGPPPPVVALGRFSPDGRLVIERVAWASGVPLSVGRQVADGVTVPAEGDGAPGADAVVAALGGPTTLLRSVLAPADRLAAVDPAATAMLAVEAGGVTRAARPLWYVRGLEPGTHAIRWALLEPATGRAVASGAAR